jgi:hypothetical protein
MQNNEDEDNNFRSYRKVGVPVIIGMTIVSQQFLANIMTTKIIVVRNSGCYNELINEIPSLCCLSSRMRNNK